MEGESLGKHKPDSFVETLRAAIAEEFGTSREFAKAWGVTPGRVAQVLSGSQELTTEKLREILRTFGSYSLAEDVHRAYVSDYTAPPNLETWAMECADPLNQIHTLVLKGKAGTAQRLALAARAKSDNPELWFLLTERIVQIESRRGRTASAVLYAKSLVSQSGPNGDVRSRAKASWILANALRNQQNAPRSLVFQSRKEAGQLLSSCRDNGLLSQILRDKALDLLSVRTISDREGLLEKAHNFAAESAHLATDENYLAMSLEVRARVEVAQKRAFLAEETLEEATQLSEHCTADFQEKMALTKASVLASRNEPDHASELLARTSAKALKAGNIHHMLKAERLLGQGQ